MENENLIDNNDMISHLSELTQYLVRRCKEENILADVYVQEDKTNEDGRIEPISKS